MKIRNELANDYHNRLPEGPFQKSFVHGAFVDGYDAGYQAAKPQWISVKERLPEIGVYVLVTHRTSEDHTNLKVMEAMRISNEEYELCGGYAILADYVDYWMPLPEAPKDK